MSRRVSVQVDIPDEWQWPEWLTAGWIAADEWDGKLSWHAYNVQPTYDAEGRYWIATGYKSIWLKENMLAFTPPPCTSAADSLRENPRRQRDER